MLMRSIIITVIMIIIIVYIQQLIILYGQGQHQLLKGNDSFTANGGLTIPSGQTLTVNGLPSPLTLTRARLLNASGGLTTGSNQNIPLASKYTASTSGQLGYTRHRTSKKQSLQSKFCPQSFKNFHSQKGAVVLCVQYNDFYLRIVLVHPPNCC